MKKIFVKVGGILLSIGILSSTLIGCTLVTTDDTKSLAREVVSIAPKSEAIVVYSQQGDKIKPIGDNNDNYHREEITSQDYPEKDKSIYKIDLKTQVDTDMSSLVSAGYTKKEAVEKSVDTLVDKALEQLSIDKMFWDGELIWEPKVNTTGDLDSKGKVDYTNQNKVLKTVYDSIKKQLFTIQNDIRKENGEDEILEGGSSSETPPFAVPPADDSVTKIPEFKLYYERETTILKEYPGSSNDANTASIEREAFKRYLKKAKTTLQNEQRLSESKRKTLIEQVDNILNDINNSTDQLVYKKAYISIGEAISDDNDVDSKTGFENQKTWDESVVMPPSGDSWVYWVEGKSIVATTMQSILSDKLQKDVEEQVKINGYDREQIVDTYNRIVERQKRIYDRDHSTYETDVADTSKTLLYMPDGNYYWVKHILLQFTDAQKAELEKIKSTSSSKEEYEQRREQLANSIVVNPIINGYKDENTKLKPTDVLNEINSVIKPLVGTDNSGKSQKAFNNLIYKYNEDTGEIDSIEKGYMVKPESHPGNPDSDGIDPQWMLEFAKAARDLRQAYDDKDSGVYHELGTLSGLVATDYGYHIVYLSDVTQNKILGLSDWINSTQKQTVEDYIKNMLLTSEKTSLEASTKKQGIANMKKVADVSRNQNYYKDLW